MSDSGDAADPSNESEEGLDRLLADLTPVEDEPEAVPAANPADQQVSELANLAGAMTEEEQGKFARRCIDRYRRDVDSRAPRMKKLKELQEMYAMIAKAKTFPFNKAANVRTPTVAGPALQIQARLVDMMIPANGELFHVLATSDDALEAAAIGEHFGNTYLRYHMPFFVEGKDSLLHHVSLYGSGFSRTYGDLQLRKVRSDTVGMDDFVVAYGCKSEDPSMADVDFYTYIHRMSARAIKKLGKGADATFINTDAIDVDAGTSASDRQGTEFTDSSRKIDGVDPDQEFEPHQVLECHCEYELPLAPDRHPAFDGETHWLVVYIDWPSEKILRVSLREEDDPDDQRRFDRDAAKMQQYAMQMAEHQAQIEAAAMPPEPQFGPDGMPMAPPPPAPIGPPPEPPFGLDALGSPSTPQPVRKRQICFFTHYRCFPSDGFYGLGYGDILYGLAIAKNTIINQHIDGVTLKNAKPGFISRNARMQKGNINVQPGEFTEVDAPISSIKDAIMFLDPPGNDPSTVPLVKLLDGMSDILAGSADMMSGQIPGSNQAAESVRILNENATMPITVLGRRLINCFRHELAKIWRCFGVFLSDDEIADVVSENGNPATANIGRDLFRPNARLVPAADPRTKGQRTQEFQQLTGFVNSHPMLGPNPQIQRQLAVLGLKLFPGGAKLAQFLPPPTPPGPPPPKPHWEEEAGWLEGQDPKVHPDDNDDEHLQGHMAMLQAPESQVMDKVQRQKAEQHIRGHVASKIRKGGQAFEQQRAAIAGGVAPALYPAMGPGPGPMAGPPGNQAPPPGIA